jgi:hypothetical protein
MTMPQDSTNTTERDPRPSESPPDEPRNCELPLLTSTASLARSTPTSTPTRHERRRTTGNATRSDQA